MAHVRRTQLHSPLFCFIQSKNVAMKTFMPFLFPTRLTAALLLTLPFLAHATGAVLLQSSNGIQVTSDDINAELQRMPTEVQTRLLTNPSQMQQLVDNVYLRRAAALDAEKNGLDKDSTVQAKLQLARETALGEAWIAKVDATVQPTNEALDTYAKVTYKAEPKRFEIPIQYQARHILLMGNGDDQRAKAEKILADLKAGASFEELAKQHSADPGSAAKGGDLGWFPKGRMVKEFDEALDTLKNPGDISGLVQSRFGLHIIKLEGFKPAQMREFSEVREQLHTEAKNKLLKEAREAAIGKLQAQAKGDPAALQSFIDAEKAKRN